MFGGQPEPGTTLRRLGSASGRGGAWKRAEVPDCKRRVPQPGVVRYDWGMTDYLLGRELPTGMPGLPSFWQMKEADLVEHALSPQDDAPICGFEGEVKSTDERWYASTSDKRCPVCVTRSGAEPEHLGP